MKVHKWIVLSCVANALLVVQVTGTTFITVEGNTASIGNGFTEDKSHPTGTHFHTGDTDRGDQVPPGNPALVDVINVAEVGGFFGDEDVRGISELDLRGLSTTTQATLLVDVFDASLGGGTPDPIGGLFGQTALDGSVDVFAYGGNNVISADDYSVAPLQGTPLMNVPVSANLNVGETFSVDVTVLLNDLIADLAANPDTASTALGVRLQNNNQDQSNRSDGAVTFDNIRLQIVPEPNSTCLLVMGMLAFAARRRKR